MKKTTFVIKIVLSFLLFGIVYLSRSYDTPQALKIQNEAMYFINHTSDIEYIAKNTYDNAKIIAKIISEKTGE